MIKTTKEYYPIETEINCFGQWDRLEDLSYYNEDEKNFIIHKAKESKKTINNHNDFENFLDEDLNFCFDQDLFEDYCEWLEHKYSHYEFDVHTISTENNNDCFFVIEANKKKESEGKQ